MNAQQVHVINSLSGKPAELVSHIMAILPELIHAVEESGWIEIEGHVQPPQNMLVRIWNADRNEEMVGKYIYPFSVSTEDQPFSGDTEYDEETDQTYWPSGWYVFADHWAEYTYHLILDNITHYKPLTKPSFVNADAEIN